MKIDHRKTKYKNKKFGKEIKRNARTRLLTTYKKRERERINLPHSLDKIYEIKNYINGIDGVWLLKQSTTPA